jgi:hypothetical protein
MNVFGIKALSVIDSSFAPCIPTLAITKKNPAT